MKVRSSFVTNSSSSSFILAVKDEGFLNSGTSKLKAFVKKVLFGGAEIIKTQEELDNFFEENYVWGKTLKEFLADEDNKWEKENYTEYLNYLQKGYLIVERTIDQNDETMNDLMSNIPDGENIIMLREGN